MSSDIRQLPVSRESLDRKHEVSDKRVRNVLIVGGASAFLVIFALIASGVTIYLLAQSHPMQHMQPLGLVLAPNLQPLERFPKPNLNIDDDHAQRMSLYRTQNVELNSYGWVDRTNGIVRIPIDRAMDLILQRGLPTQTNGAPETDGSALQLIQQIPEEK